MDDRNVVASLQMLKMNMSSLQRGLSIWQQEGGLVVSKIKRY